MAKKRVFWPYSLRGPFFRKSDLMFAWVFGVEKHDLDTFKTIRNSHGAVWGWEGSKMTKNRQKIGKIRIFEN